MCGSCLVFHVACSHYGVTESAYLKSNYLMELINHTGLPLLQFSHFKNIDGLVHGVTTRKGGVSEGPFFSLNLGTQTGDDPQRVFCNRNKLLSHLNWDSLFSSNPQPSARKKCRGDNQRTLE